MWKPRFLCYIQGGQVNYANYHAISAQNFLLAIGLNIEGLLSGLPVDLYILTLKLQALHVFVLKKYSAECLNTDCSV